MKDILVLHAPKDGYRGVTINRDTTKGVKSLANIFIGRRKTSNNKNRS